MYRFRKPFILFMITCLFIVFTSCKQSVKKDVELSKNAELLKLSLGDYKFNEANLFEATLPGGYKFESSAEKLNFSLKTASAKSSVKVSLNGGLEVGVPLTDSYGSLELTLSDHENIFKIVVTAEAGNTNNYLIKIVKTDSTPAGLFKLFKFNDEVLEISESSHTFNRTVEENGSASLYIKTMLEDDRIEVRLNNVVVSPVAADNSKFNLPLIGGNNTALVKVKDKNGIVKTPVVTITITKLTENLSKKDISLSVLSFNGKSILNKLSSDGLNCSITADDVSAETADLIVTPNNSNVLVEVKKDYSIINKINGKYTIPLKHGNNTFTVKLTSEDKTKIRLITVNVNRPLSLDLTNLKITYNNENISSDFVKGKSDIKANISNVDGTKTLRITAYAETGTNVTVDDVTAEGSATKIYSNFNIPGGSGAEKIVSIKVSSGVTNKVYQLKLIKSDYNMQVNVIGFVGGSSVSGSTVEVYRAGTATKVASGKTGLNGTAYFSLIENEKYDFKAAGIPNKRVESIVENVKVEAGKINELVIIQRAASAGYKTVSPKILDIKYAKRTSTGVTITNNTISDDYILNASTVYNDNGLIFVKFACPSSKITSAGDDDGNFGVSIGVGSSPDYAPNMIGYGGSSSPGYNIGFLVRPIVISNQTMQNSDGSWTCSFGFELQDLCKNVVFNGKENLFITAYDTAGNRFEKRIEIDFKNNNLTPKLDSSNPKLKNLSVEINRYSRPIYTYGVENNNYPITVIAGEGLNDSIGVYSMQPHEGFETSLQAVFSFTDYYSGHSRIEIYKREYAANLGVNDNWELAAIKVLPKTKNIDRKVALVDHSLKENTVYQFKIKNYNVSAYGNDVTYSLSDIATSSTSLPFFAVLEFPADNAVFTQTEAKNLDFKFKISNKELLNENNSDAFYFGFSLKNKEGDTLNCYYFTKVQYRFGVNNDTALLIWDSVGKKYKTLADWKSSVSSLAGKTVNDLISIDKNTGVVTIKKAFLSVKNFNIDLSGKLFYDLLGSGKSYHWDIVDEGDSANTPYDDLDACRFIKIWQAIDSSTGSAIAPSAENISLVVSYGNVFTADGAVNGRFAFTVK